MVSKPVVFYWNHTTCFGSPNTSSGVYRLDINRQMQLILYHFNLNMCWIPCYFVWNLQISGQTYDFPTMNLFKAVFFLSSWKGCLFFRSQCTQYPGIPSLAVSFPEVKLSSTVLHNSGCYFKCIPFRQCKLLHSRRTTYLVPVCRKDPSQAPRDTGTVVKSLVP